MSDDSLDLQLQEAGRTIASLEQGLAHAWAVNKRLRTILEDLVNSKVIDHGSAGAEALWARARKELETIVL